ncbi:hypothetical protein [Psychrobacter sp. APC 3350]|uniref:hypothetical protein n=1 Tax=Psychrobacter sp. APC 3350 TaxID=3035195 RepID=UPI0025B3AD79|nr:hypothetical protein [Psychrobacter sp. APC 3350]MDN3453825.1 hypothetical protein [Psychrobacter sp. APC 3350]
MATTDKSVWIPFFNALSSFYENLVDEDGQISNVMYESKAFLYRPSKVDKHYRAVIRVRDVNAYKEELEHVATEFYAAHREANKREKNYDPTKIPRLPIYLPRINADENIFKMQIHENRAHASKNYKKNEMIPVISVLRSAMLREAFDASVQALKGNGYTVIVDDDKKSPYLMASINAARLCELYECDSIQRRFSTGRQIRANFFSRVDGKLQRSKLESVGVLLVDRDIEVVHSHERTTRTDAIYTAEHPDEILLDDIPPVLRSGRLYRKYKAK